MIEKPKGHLMVNFLGLRGAGKTLSAMFQEVLPRYLRGEKIVSTSFINLKGVDIIHTPEDCLKLRNCVLFIDELGDFVDSYDWANISQDFRRFLRLSRKRKVDIITTAQDISYIAKPLRVLFSDWVFCENATPAGLVAKILSWFHIFRIKIKQQELTANELIKLQKGVGNNPLVDNTNDDDLDDFSEDFDLDDFDFEKKITVCEYTLKGLIRSDLTDLKIYNYQEFCSFCDTGFEYIEKEKEDNLIDYNKKLGLFFKKERLCPVCSKPLSVREVGIYDTDYEIPVPPVPNLIFKPFIPSPEGYQLVSYKGMVPDTQKPPIA